MAATSWEVIALYKQVIGIGTLREHITAVNSKINKEQSLFLSVDTSFFRTNEVIFTFLPRHETEARNFVTQMVPFFYHKLKSEKITQIFQPEALERAKETIWDAENEEIVTLSDLYLDTSTEVKDDFDILEVIGIEETVKNRNPADIKKSRKIICGRRTYFSGITFYYQERSRRK
jgi:hypothetical protein